MRALIVIAVLGCSKGASPELREDVATFFETMDHDPDFLPKLDVALATRDDLRNDAMDDWPVVELGPARLTLDRQREVKQLDGMAGLARELDAVNAAVATGRVARGFDRSGILIAIAGDTPWKRVAEALGVIEKAGFVHATFVFARTPKTPPPPRSAVSDELDKIIADPDASNKVSAIAQLTTRVIGECREMALAFGSVGSVEVGDRSAMLLAALARILRTTDCKVDLASLRSVMWAVAGNPHPRAALALVLDADAPALAIDGTTPWREASKRLPVSKTHVGIVH